MKLDFTKKPIIGMIHLSGSVERSLKEAIILREEGVKAIIVENYHGSVEEVENTLYHLSLVPETRELSVGVNILPNDYELAMKLASEYNFDFVQVDFVAGKYKRATEIDESKFEEIRKKYSNIQILGGVWPKYYEPEEGSSLEDDLRTAMSRCDAIVVTGAGTGKETPLDKIKKFRAIIGNFPLIIGAGINSSNVQEQLQVGDGAIVGSAFKEHSYTHNMIRRDYVREIMSRI